MTIDYNFSFIYIHVYILVIPRLAGNMADILECQEAITSGFALGISLPDTQVYPHVPSKGGV